MMLPISMESIDLNHKKVLIREDFNVPLKQGVISNDARIQAAIPTIKQALAQNAKVIVMSHLGRPTEGTYDEALSLAPVARRLSELLGQPVSLAKEWLSGVTVREGQVVLCENVRFNRGEEDNDSTLAKQMAKLCDVFVMDAFATAHRAQASTHGVAAFAPIACAGPLMMAELDALANILHAPKRPLVAIIGGAKVSTKLTLLHSLRKQVDQLIVGGGIANTFIAAQGYSVGKSLYEKALLGEASQLVGEQLPLPMDVIVATSLAEDAVGVEKNVDAVKDDEMILDIGSKTIAHYQAIIAKAHMIIWNGPVGVFEHPAFEKGTRAIARAIARSDAFSVAGGGDTIAAIDKYNIRNNISYISTGGGAFLEYLEGKTLPAVEVLQRRAKEGVTYAQ